MTQRPHLCLPPVTHTSNAFGLTSKMMCVGIGALSRISWCRQVVDSEKCRSLTVTLHFFLAKARDRCRPIPDPPPVTSAVLPDHSMPSTSQSDSWTVLNALKCCMRITTQLHKLCKPLQESSICSCLGVPASVFAAGWVTGCLVGYILLYIQRGFVLQIGGFGTCLHLSQAGTPSAPVCVFKLTQVCLISCTICLLAFLQRSSSSIGRRKEKKTCLT